MKNLKMVSFVLLVISLGSPFVLNIFAQRGLVETLELRGNVSVTKEEILKEIRTRPGGVYREKNVKEDFQRVLKTGKFDLIYSRIIVKEGSSGGMVVTFVLKELPKEN